MDTESEYKIIKQIMNGEYEQYAMLIEEHQNKLFTFIYRIVNNREDAEDLTQDTFIKAYKSIHSFRFKSKFSTWLYQIGYNNSCNLIKRIKKKREIEKGIHLDNPANFIRDVEHNELNEITMMQFSK